MKKGFLALAVTLLAAASAQAGMQDYAGSYKGKFDGKKGTLHIAVNGGTMSASFTGANGSSDILGGSCGSSIGRMTDIDMDGAKVDYVVFAFNPGSCKYNVEGRELFVDFGHDDGKLKNMRVSLLVQRDNWGGGGGYNCFPTPGGGVSCLPDTQPPQDWYATGKFKK